MNRIIFVEGTPGVGKTTLANKMLMHGAGSESLTSIYSADVIPVNMVRRAVKEGLKLSLEEARTIYRERPYVEYKKEHMRIWRDFCRQNADLGKDFLVEGGLIQAPLYELMGLYMLPEEEILHHLQETVDIISEAFSPEIIYVKTANPVLCIRKAMEKQKAQRGQWVSGFCRWLDVAPYPMERGYSGTVGIERFVEERSFVDSFLLDHLRIRKNIYTRDRV